VRIGKYQTIFLLVALSACLIIGIVTFERIPSAKEAEPLKIEGKLISKSNNISFTIDCNTNDRIAKISEPMFLCNESLGFSNNSAYYPVRPTLNLSLIHISSDYKREIRVIHPKESENGKYVSKIKFALFDAPSVAGTYTYNLEMREDFEQEFRLQYDRWHQYNYQTRVYSESEINQIEYRGLIILLEGIAAIGVIIAIISNFLKFRESDMEQDRYWTLGEED
jgi:hypothetical protein